MNTVVTRSETQGLVRQLNDNVYTVDLVAKTCSCTVFQENGIPCGHTVTTIFARPGRDLTPYMPKSLSISTWKKTYSSNFPLIDTSTFKNYLFQTAILPLTRVPRGRPKRDSRKIRYEGLGERLPHKLWQSLQEMERKKYGHYITVRLVESEGTFLRPVGGHTIKGWERGGLRIVAFSCVF